MPAAAHSRTAVQLLAIAMLLLGVAGCQRWNWRGSGYGNDTPRWGEKLRTPTEAGQSAGLDSRAKEIERNLGVR